MKKKRIYRKRQWTRQAARKVARKYRCWARQAKRSKVRRIYITSVIPIKPMEEGSSISIPRLRCIKKYISKKERENASKNYLRMAALAEAYSKGRMIQVQLLNSAGITCGWRAEPNPFNFILTYSLEALRVEPDKTRS